MKMLSETECSFRTFELACMKFHATMRRHFGRFACVFYKSGKCSCFLLCTSMVFYTVAAEVRFRFFTVVAVLGSTCSLQRLGFWLKSCPSLQTRTWTGSSSSYYAALRLPQIRICELYVIVLALSTGFLGFQSGLTLSLCGYLITI